MLHTSGIVHVFAICLAGFDEILTLEWGASSTGRPFHLVDLSTPEEEPFLIQFLAKSANRHSYRLILRQRAGKRANRPFEVLELALSGFPTNQELTERSFQAGRDFLNFMIPSAISAYKPAFNVAKIE